MTDSVDDILRSATPATSSPSSSSATNLDPNCTNAQWQIFVRTRSTGTTECISVDGNGVHGFGDSGEPHITADGRLVVFDSEASNLVAGDTNVAQDVFVRDLVTDTTERVNLKEDGTQSDGWAFWPDVSADGRYVVYRTGFGDQDPACPPGPAAIILTDRKSDTNECLSVDAHRASRQRLRGSAAHQRRRPVRHLLLDRQQHRSGVWSTPCAPGVPTVTGVRARSLHRHDHL